MPTDVEKVYFSLELSASQRLMLFSQWFKKKLYLHLRLWYQPEEGAEYRPGRGLVLPNNPVNLHELGDAFHAMANDFPWDTHEEG